MASNNEYSVFVLSCSWGRNVFDGPKCVLLPWMFHMSILSTQTFQMFTCSLWLRVKNVLYHGPIEEKHGQGQCVLTTGVEI